MILGQISWADCFVFLLFLAPQLIIHVGFFRTAICGLTALPFLGQSSSTAVLDTPPADIACPVVRMPYQLIRERYFTKTKQQSPFVQRASLFQDIVIRCVRYAFADIPAAIGKVFFSKWVALPFMKFRMLRHGIWKTPIYWREVNRVSCSTALAS